MTFSKRSTGKTCVLVLLGIHAEAQLWVTIVTREERGRRCLLNGDHLTLCWQKCTEGRKIWSSGEKKYKRSDKTYFEIGFMKQGRIRRFNRLSIALSSLASPRVAAAKAKLSGRPSNMLSCHPHICPCTYIRFPLVLTHRCGQTCIRHIWYIL